MLSGLALISLSFLGQPYSNSKRAPEQSPLVNRESSWSRPINLSKPAVSAESPAIAVNDFGALVAVWARQQGTIYNVQASTGAGTKWSKAVNLSLPNVTALQPSVTIDNTGAATAVWSSQNVIQSSTYRPRQGWSAPIAISDVGVSALAPQVTVDGAGNLLAVWVRYDIEGQPALEAADCPFGQQWSPPFEIATEAPEDFTLVSNAAGDAAVIWNTGSFASSKGVYCSTRQAGAIWSDAYMLAPAASQQGGAKIAMAANGDVTACWRTASQIQVADKLNGGNWTSAMTLYSNLTVDEFPVLAEAASGDVTAAWMADGRVYTSTRPVLGVWTTPVPLTNTQEHDEDLHAASTPDGSFILSWINRNSGEFRSSTSMSGSLSWSAPVTIARTQYETALAAAHNTAAALWIGNSFMATVSTTPMSAPSGGGELEQYGTSSTGVALRWVVFEPSGVGQHPAVLVLHPGGFKSGNAGPLNVARDLGNAGFLALATEYRLAPPHTQMNAPEHAPPSQNTVSPIDEGYYPEQTTDVQMAIRAARRDPRCNGLVYCVGGSAGASHSAYMAATGIAGDDQPDLVVLCSGVYDLADPAFLSLDCDNAPDETCPSEASENYLNLAPDSWPQHLPELATASPNSYVTQNVCPIFILAASDDAIGIDIQFTDLIVKLNSVGVTETISSIPQRGHYKEWVIPLTGGHHAFEYWAQAKPAIVAWLQAGPPQDQ